MAVCFGVPAHQLWRTVRHCALSIGHWLILPVETAEAEISDFEPEPILRTVPFGKDKDVGRFQILMNSPEFCASSIDGVKLRKSAKQVDQAAPQQNHLLFGVWN